jgi:murein DD-endopeptidase MepM/ murein hydrolase activator NlpD
MKHLWTTATALALCVAASGTRADPASPLTARSDARLLVRVATEPSTTAHHKRKHKPAASSSAAHKKTAKGRHGKRHAATEASASHKGRHHRGASSEIHTAAPAPIKVGKRDTLTSISRKTGVPVEELARLNHLKKPYHVQLGQRIKLPARRYYMVKSGETLYSLARRFGVESSELAELNGMKAGGHVRSGQRLYLPAGAEAAAPEEAFERAPRRPSTPYTTVAPVPYTPPSGQPATQAAPQPAAPVQPPSSQGFQLAPQGQPAQPPAAQPGGRTIVPTGPAPSSADVSAAGKGKFVWPVMGDVMSGFGPKPDGQRNDGVNIMATAGDPVRAAADGEVVYAGDQVPSFGNLVLIKHAGGWVTAYAHMSKILVKNRDQVTQGQEIGDVGQTGQVASPQLHFEIRYAPSAKDKAVPIDPMLVLPAK